MAENLRLLRTLQLISETARKINPATRPINSTPKTPTILRSLPKHRSLLPLLLAHDVPPRLAEACAERYDKHASELRSRTETKLAPYLANRDGGQPASIYSVFLKSYSKALRDWSQTVLNAALKNLKRDFVQLHNWEVTYPPPLWLPPAADAHPMYAPSISQKPCPMSPASTPPHAFPTTYPPALRPPLKLPAVEWSRTSATPSSPLSAPAIDLDSLCMRFTKSLVIDENPPQPSPLKGSIFSLPNMHKPFTSCHPSTRPLKRKPSKVHCSQGLPPSKPSILSPVKPRRLSVPPFLSPSSKIRTMPRRASAPTPVSSKDIKMSRKFADFGCHPSPTTTPSFLSTPTTDRSDGSASPDPTTPPLTPPPSLDSAFSQTTQNPQGSLHSPTTPPTLLPDLFSDPLVVPSLPVHLLSGSSPASVTDPVTQFQFQDNCLSAAPLHSPYYCEPRPGLSASSFPSKTGFDTLFGSDYLFHGIPLPITPNYFEGHLFNTYAVF